MTRNWVGGVVAKIKAGEIIEHLAPQLRRALEDAVAQTMPGANIDTQEFFKIFRRAVGRKCRAWEQVPDSYVDCD